MKRILIKTGLVFCSGVIIALGVWYCASMYWKDSSFNRNFLNQYMTSKAYASELRVKGILCTYKSVQKSLGEPKVFDTDIPLTTNR